MKHWGAALALALLIGGPQASAKPNKPGWAPPAPRPIGPSIAKDINPAPNIVEINLVASENFVQLGRGHRVKAYTYNGGTPGPTIMAKVGDTLIVNFRNKLSEGTTIHWHGLEIPANMDGSNISQNAVPPGGSFRYEFKLRRASTFWYHPHANTNVQVEKGLYGALVVTDPREDRRLPKQSHVLLLDDILLDAKGEIAPAFPSDPVENAAFQVNGREGNVMLVNGKTGSRAVIKRCVPHRFRLVNTANSRMMRVSIKGHTMWRIGGDGGLLEKPILIQPIGLVPHPMDATKKISDPDPAKGLLLTPGERADIIFVPNKSGPIDLEWHDYPRGLHKAFLMADGTSVGLEHNHHMDGRRPHQTLMTFVSAGQCVKCAFLPGGCNYTPPSSLRTIQPIDITGAGKLPVMFGHSLPNTDGDVMFFAQMVMGAPKPFPMVTPAMAHTVTIGDTRVWEVNNMTGGDHNFHIHGFSFQAIEIEYVDMDTPANNYKVKYPYREIKDTILIPKRPGAKGRSRTIVRLATKFDDTGREGLAAASGKVPGTNTSGGWVFHCHILEHSARGMMSFLQVENP